MPLEDEGDALGRRLNDTDKCYFIGEYTARAGFSYSATNDLKSWTIYKFLRTCCRRKSEFGYATEAEVLDCVADAGEVIRSLRDSLKILERRRHSHIAHISKELVFNIVSGKDLNYRLEICARL
jgi:hypothetical protein